MLLLAAAFFPGLNSSYRLHPDEALYATYGRMVSRGDLLMTGVFLDKPPLLFYTIGLSFRLMGVSEFSARLPGVFATLLCLAVAYSLARRLYGLHIALLTLFLLILSPIIRAFAPTAFTDPLMMLFVLLSVLFAVRGGWRWSGVWMGVAFGVKPSALQWIPLALLLGVVIENQLRWRHIWRFFLFFGLMLSLLILWQVARDTAPDFWTLNGINNNPGRFIRSEEVAPRFVRWGEYAMMVFPLFMVGWLSIIVNHPFPIASPALKHRAINSSTVTGDDSALAQYRPNVERKNRSSVYSAINSVFSILARCFSAGKVQRSSQNHAYLVDLILTTYTLGSMALLWLVAFNTYDRYLLPLAPFLLMLVARVFGRPGIVRGGIIALVVVMLLTPTVHIGGDNGAYTGIDNLATELNTLPAGSIVYEHWLGWELGFYLGEKPAINLVWLPTVGELINSPKPCYFVAPLNEAQAWLDELDKAGISFQKFYISGRFAVFRMGTFER